MSHITTLKAEDSLPLDHVKGQYFQSNVYDLKSSYQRNMLTSMTLVIGLATLLSVSIWIAESLSEEAMVKVQPEPIEQEVTISILPSIKRDNDEIKPVASVQPIIGIPEPVPDDSPLDVEETNFKTDDVGTGDTSGVSSSNTSMSIGLEGDASEYFPNDTELIITERPAEIVQIVKPVYPRLAREAGLEGVVWIKSLIDRQGIARDSKIARSSGIEILDQAALIAAPKSIFTPAIQNGHPVATWVTYKVVFEVEEN